MSKAAPPVGDLRSRGRALLDRVEKPLLALAGLAVGAYLLDLRGLWFDLGVRNGIAAMLLVIDCIFVVDLIARIALLDPRYRRSAWLLVDVFAAAPIVASVAAVPGFVYALRFLRGFRVLRALRALRLLRGLPGVGRAVARIEAEEALQPTPEMQAWNRALVVAVLAYTAVFLGLLVWIRGEVVHGRVVAWADQPLAQAPQLHLTIDDGHGFEHVTVSAAAALQGAASQELWLVVGALLGMGLVLFVVRYQIPALASRQVRALLNVALPHQVANYFLRHPEAYDRTERGEATVIFCDIQGFTTTVEALGDDLDTVKKHLERAMDVVVEQHRRYDLIVDKFIGDAIMSFRGGSLVPGTPEDHARRVVRATLAGAAALRELQDPYFSRMKTGGASARRALIGTFGTSSRLSYTVLGDRVNLAARLEGSCNALGVTNLFCDRTRSLCGELEGVVWRPLGVVAVQGKGECVEVFEAFDVGAEPMDWLAPFAAGLAAWRVGDLAAAEVGFLAARDARVGGDRTCEVYLRAIAGARGSSRPFEPVLRTTKG